MVGSSGNSVSPSPAATVLTIAGFDPSSGAGVTADLMVFAAHRLFGTSCVTALTVQSTLGVQSSHPVSAETANATLDCLHADLPPAGIKIGMLATAANVMAVADYLATVRAHSPSIPVVLDPVLRASSGRELLDTEGLTVLRERLLPLVDWITPNLAELAILSGEPAITRDNLASASFKLQIVNTRLDPDKRKLGIFATGGHLNPPDDFLLLPRGEKHWLRGERIETSATHGTGCALSSAFLCRLVAGDTALEAAQAAKRYVAEALRSAVPHGHGNGPLNLLWPLIPGRK
jgi:hydroxymethylpyrimidine/phosphomethylpyrimidine kinase